MRAGVIRLVYYAIKLKSIPRIEFAFSVETNKYKNIISNRKKMIETSYIANGGFWSEFEGRKYKIEGNTVCLYMPDMEVINYSENDDYVRMLDVAFYVDKMDYESFECVSKNDWNTVKDKYSDYIIIPFKMKFENMNESIVKAFYTIIQLQSKSSVGGELLKVAEWFRVLSLINDEARRLLSLDFEYSNSMVYLRKIEKYVQNNYSKRITLGDIAKEVEISQSYLCRIFKENLNETFVSYLNKTRVNKARELLNVNKELKASEIAEKVGFCDLRYMNKMFKRYYGISVRECRRLDNELTLFHKKPWDAEELSGDIYTTEQHAAEEED